MLMVCLDWRKWREEISFICIIKGGGDGRGGKRSEEYWKEEIPIRFPPKMLSKRNSTDVEVLRVFPSLCIMNVRSFFGL